MINVTMSVDLAPAAASDDIAGAVNYRTVAKAIIAHVEQGSPMLVERLAEEIAALCLATDARIVEGQSRRRETGCAALRRVGRGFDSQDSEHAMISCRDLIGKQHRSREQCPDRIRSAAQAARHQSARPESVLPVARSRWRSGIPSMRPPSSRLTIPRRVARRAPGNRGGARSGSHREPRRSPSHRPRCAPVRGLLGEKWQVHRSLTPTSPPAPIWRFRPPMSLPTGNTRHRVRP